MIRTLDFLLSHCRDAASVQQIKEALQARDDATVLLKNVVLRFVWGDCRVYITPREDIHDAKLLPVELPYDVLMELLEVDHE